MKCTRCHSPRILKIRARAKDMHDYEFMGEQLEGSYAVDFSEDGDTTKIDVCMTCGQVQGYAWPLVSVGFEYCGFCGEPHAGHDHSDCKED